MQTRTLVGVVVLATLSASGSALSAVEFAWSTIGHAGNAPDPLTGFGSVGHEYQIASHEVTVAQWVEFLNAKASVADPYGLHDGNTSAASLSGIVRNGTPGSYVYSAVAGWESRPVVWIKSRDARRFINWLHNGQGSGDTETGAYSMADDVTETRSPTARYFLPDENEWYKAAYFQPTSAGGDIDSYWLYPHSANSVPVAGIDANYNFFSSQLMSVGSFAPNYFGVYDLGGNAMEFTESTLFVGTLIAPAMRGGTYGTDESWLRSTWRWGVPQSLEYSNDQGFRVARPIPTPAAGIVVASLGGLTWLRRRRA